MKAKVTATHLVKTLNLTQWGGYNGGLNLIKVFGFKFYKFFSTRGSTLLSREGDLCARYTAQREAAKVCDSVTQQSVTSHYYYCISGETQHKTRHTYFGQKYISPTATTGSGLKSDSLLSINHPIQSLIFILPFIVYLSPFQGQGVIRGGRFKTLNCSPVHHSNYTSLV